MKILIMSDSHLNNDGIKNILNHHNDINIIIHCGDIGQEYQLENNKTMYIVRGNNDFLPLKNDIITTIENKNFFITHGHLYDVEFNFDELINKALENQCQYVCFGHTHNPIYQVVDNIHLINPGSISFPRGGKIFVPTYCILDGTNVDFYHAKTYENINHLFLPKPKKSLFKKIFNKKMNHRN